MGFFAWDGGGNRLVLYADFQAVPQCFAPNIRSAICLTLDPPVFSFSGVARTETASFLLPQWVQCLAAALCSSLIAPAPCCLT